MWLTFGQKGSRALWSTDGTSEGTHRLLDLNETFTRSFTSRIELDGQLIFNRQTDELGDELWVTDGTTEGAELLADFEPGSRSSFPKNLIRVGDLIYGFARTPQETNGLFLTDGTPEGTRRSPELYPTLDPGNPKWLATDGRRLYMVFHNTEVDTRELWTLEGRQDSVLIADGVTSSTITINGRLPFQLITRPKDGAVVAP